MRERPDRLLARVAARLRWQLKGSDKDLRLAELCIGTMLAAHGFFPDAGGPKAIAPWDPRAARDELAEAETAIVAGLRATFGPQAMRLVESVETAAFTLRSMIVQYSFAAPVRSASVPPGAA